MLTELLSLARNVNSAVVGSLPEAPNRQSIRASLAPGDYTLTLLHTPDGTDSAAPCARFGFRLHVDFVPAAEEHVRHDADCDADTLPLSFNMPGLLSPAQGRLRLFEDFRFDTDSLRQDVELSVGTPSLFRLVVSHPALQVDVRISGKEASEVVDLDLHHTSGPLAIGKGHPLDLSRDEGVFVYLNPGNYSVVVTVDDAVLDSDGFCTVVRIAAECAPYPAGTSEYAQRLALCSEGSPDGKPFDDLPELGTLSHLSFKLHAS